MRCEHVMHFMFMLWFWNCLAVVLENIYIYLYRRTFLTLQIFHPRFCMGYSNLVRKYSILNLSLWNINVVFLMYLQHVKFISLPPNLVRSIGISMLGGSRSDELLGNESSQNISANILWTRKFREFYLNASTKCIYPDLQGTTVLWCPTISYYERNQAASPLDTG